jgi:ElaB/YqjD/DUF883 family membrane-anchored ribosome-binding protein
MSEGLAQVRDYTERAIEQAREKLSQLREEGENYIRENPTKAIVGALGVGFVIGLLMRR